MAETSGVMFNGTTESRGAAAQVSHGFGRFYAVPLLSSEDSMRKIPLTQGKYALVDDEDYDELMKHKWFCGNSEYGSWAGRNDRKKRVTIYMHREIMKTPPGLETDHVNHSRLDNRRANLRICTKIENMRNQHKPKGKTSSQYKGVCWHKRDSKWCAYIRIDHKCVSLGYHLKEEAAARAYDKAARKHFKGFACLNFPKKGD